MSKNVRGFIKLACKLWFKLNPNVLEGVSVLCSLTIYLNFRIFYKGNNIRFKKFSQD